MGLRRKGQFAGATALITFMILGFVMAAIGTFVLTSIGSRDTTTSGINAISESYGPLANGSIQINRSSITSASFILFNSSTIIGSGNYSLQFVNNATTGAKYYNLVLTTITGVGSAVSANYTFNVLSGAAYNVSGNSAQAIVNWSAQMAVYGIVAVAMLILTLVILIAGLLGKRY